MFKKVSALLSLILIIPLASCSLFKPRHTDVFNICVRNSSEVSMYGVGLEVHIDDENSKTGMAQNKDKSELYDDYIVFAIQDIPLDDEHEFSFKVRFLDENEKEHTIDQSISLQEMEPDTAYYYSINGSSIEDLEIKNEPEPEEIAQEREGK